MADVLCISIKLLTALKKKSPEIDCSLLSCCPGHCRMVRILSSFSPVGISSNPPSHSHQKVSPDIDKYPLRGNIPPPNTKIQSHRIRK